MSSSRTSQWIVQAVIAMLVLGVVAVALRFFTTIHDSELMWDEIVMVPVVEDFIEHGWNAGTMIHYEDTKGPVFFWLYGVVAEIAGPDVPVLRTFTIVLFVLSGIPFGYLCSKARLSSIETGLASLMLALTPYHALLGQLFMSETSFVLGEFALVVVFLRGFQAQEQQKRAPVAALIGFTMLLSALLHHRPHIVAIAGAMVFVAAERDRVMSWPWWAACIIAGLSRLPLFFVWGGMVSPSYQGRAGLGLRIESVTYLIMSLLPATLVFLWPFLRERQSARRIWIGGGVLVGVALGLLAPPNLTGLTDDGRPNYLGMVATALRYLPNDATVRIAIAMCAALGGLALAAFLATSLRPALREARGTIERLCGWLLLFGVMLYGLTRGQVFDRYTLSFMVLLPLAWVIRLPRWLLLVQGAGLAGMLVMHLRLKGVV